MLGHEKHDRRHDMQECGLPIYKECLFGDDVIKSCDQTGYEIDFFWFTAFLNRAVYNAIHCGRKFIF